MNETTTTVIDRVETTNSERTGKRYAGSLRVWKKWCDENGISPLEADTLDVEDYLRDLYENKDYASSTLGVHRSAIKSFFSEAVKLSNNGRIQAPSKVSDMEANPVTTVTMSDVVTEKSDRRYTKRDRELQNRDETKGLTDSEATAVIDSVPSPSLRNEVLLRLAYQGMLRRGEVTGLKTSDIFLDEQRVVVRPETAKNGKRRTTYFQSSLLSPLKMWLNVDRKGHHDASTSDYVFLSDSGGKITGYHVGEIYRKAVEAAEIGQEVLYTDASGTDRLKYIFHDLRHAGAKRRWRNGCDLRTIQKLLGHESIEVTIDYLDVEVESLGDKAKASW